MTPYLTPNPNPIPNTPMTPTPHPHSEYIEQNWIGMSCKVLTLLSLVTSVRPDSVLPYVLRERVVEGVCRVLAQCWLLTSPSTLTPPTLSLTSALVSFLLTLVGMAPSPAGRELVFTNLQLHWESFTGQRSIWCPSPSTKI